jgi:hypothetical protein
MSALLLAPSTSFEWVDLRQPFSNFRFVEKRFGDFPAIRRLFSQSRVFGGKTLLIEDVPAVGSVASENEDLCERFPRYEMRGLKRLTFWARSIRSESELSHTENRHLLGYAILKHDHVSGSDTQTVRDRWHVFESVFVKYPHSHNYVPNAKTFCVRVGKDQPKLFAVQGAIYCQQNGLNKACAQVALRSLCAQHLDEDRVTYRRIHELALRAIGSNFDPAKGLNSTQIRAVLDGFSIGYDDVDYLASPKKDRAQIRKDYPYQKFLYAGMESGGGALLGFEFAGSGAKNEKHIIPFHGHTFNADTWVPHAEAAYFHVGDDTKYLPSEAWVSSFIGHDDNFGSNFCVPRLYVTREQVQYVAGLRPTGARYGGVVAEAIATDYLYSILPNLDAAANEWLQRLLYYTSKQEVTLRAVAVTLAQYVQYLRQVRDWDMNRENLRICRFLGECPVDRLWMVEISLPQLFPANQRKLGEIIFDATAAASSRIDFATFLFARVPGVFLFLNGLRERKPDFLKLRSRLASHTPLFSG